MTATSQKPDNLLRQISYRANLLPQSFSLNLQIIYFSSTQTEERQSFVFFLTKIHGWCS